MTATQPAAHTLHASGQELANYANRDILEGSCLQGENPAMPTRNVNLTDRNAAFVDRLIESGHYKNASEVCRAGLRLLEKEATEEEQKLKVLRKLARKGFEELDQGNGIPLNSEEKLAAHVAGIGRKVSSQVDYRK